MAKSAPARRDGTGLICTPNCFGQFLLCRSRRPRPRASILTGSPPLALAAFLQPFLQASFSASGREKCFKSSIARSSDCDSPLSPGYVARYSGMDAVLGLAFTRTGWLFAFFGTFIGWLGVALTG